MLSLAAGKDRLCDRLPKSGARRLYSNDRAFGSEFVLDWLRERVRNPVLTVFIGDDEGVFMLSFAQRN